MPTGVAIAVVAYALYSCCDAIIKAFGTSLSVHEIAFWIALFSFLPAIFTKPRGEHWHLLWQMRHPWLINLRASTGVVGNFCIIYAFVHVPLAEVYSLSFLAPIFIVGLSVLTLGERVSWTRWAFLAASFLGILLVVRPGFRDLQLGHLAAVAAAFMGGVTTTVLRRVAPVEKRVSLISVPLAYILVVNGVLMIPTFGLPTPEEFGLLVLIGGLGGTGNILFIAATRRAPANQIAPAQYSQLAWAIVLGAMFYGEYPDLVTYVGLTIVTVFGILNVISDETRIRIFSRFSPGLGPSTAIAEVARPLPDAQPAPDPAPGLEPEPGEQPGAAPAAGRAAGGTTTLPHPV